MSFISFSFDILASFFTAFLFTKSAFFLSSSALSTVVYAAQFIIQLIWLSKYVKDKISIKHDLKIFMALTSSVLSMLSVLFSYFLSRSHNNINQLKFSRYTVIHKDWFDKKLGSFQKS